MVLSLKFSECMTAKNQIGSTINAGSHLDKIAKPILTPARMLNMIFLFSANSMEKKTPSSIKNKKKISMWSVAALPPTRSIINPFIEKKNAERNPTFLLKKKEPIE